MKQEEEEEKSFGSLCGYLNLNLNLNLELKLLLLVVLIDFDWLVCLILLPFWL